MGVTSLRELNERSNLTSFVRRASVGVKTNILLQAKLREVREINSSIPSVFVKRFELMSSVLREWLMRERVSLSRRLILLQCRFK